MSEAETASNAGGRTWLLQSASVPRDAMVGTPEELCFRAIPRDSWRFDPADGRLLVLTPQSTTRRVLDFSTYFGAFSLTTWCGVAGLDEVIVEIRFTGGGTLKFYEDNGYEGRTLLSEQRVTAAGEPFRQRLGGLRGRRGILFPVFEMSYGDDFELTGIDYLTSTPPLYTPRLAIVMPTFRREAYALRAIDMIVNSVLPLAVDQAHLFVIDNGQTLEPPASNGVTLVPNRNFGGAGGFARGVIEATEAAGFSHLLFCDDDVLIDPQSVLRLIALLRYLSQDRIVSGGMLKMGQRSVLHEKNANVVGMTFSSNRGNDDLTRVEAVARHDESGFASFCGWWFACYPLASGADSFLPLPFFVGWDDVEMGRRCNRLHLGVVSLLGIGVWHEEFEKKDVTWRWYYHVRNGLATSMIYDDDASGLRQAIVEIMTALLTYRYERAEYMLDGLAAVAHGSGSVTDTAADALHDTLTARQRCLFRDVSGEVIPERLYRRRKNSMLRSLFAKLTMNGHLLPRWTFLPAREPVDSGWTVEPLHSTRLGAIFRCPRVVYYEPISGKGMICRVDHARYYRLLVRMLVLWLKLRFRWNDVRAGWRRDHAMLTSAPFWKRYLGLDA